MKEFLSKLVVVFNPSEVVRLLPYAFDIVNGVSNNLHWDQGSKVVEIFDEEKPLPMYGLWIR